MIFKKPLKIFLFPAVNILLAIFLLWAFYFAGLNIVQSLPAARLNALNYLRPQPIDYLWQLNIQNAPLDIEKIRFYADYFERLLQVFPELRDVYGLLGYCYHNLGDDVKAVDYLKKAIEYNPLYTWNYYDLAAIYISQSRYLEASSLLQKIQFLNPQLSLQRMFASQYIYTPLIDVKDKEMVSVLAEHLKLSYRVSFELVQLINQISYNKNVENEIKRMHLELYAF